ncbi:MAG TPA: hypothetical protein DCW68_06775 [Rhodospirillaceae bacterium]|nr:MAG: hypothetical protein A2018_01285 [Alphaproteobacteria bacterium GWF2_58_20]HAU29791.1 hypothetical protein [Rhodospirillaceae bacterium]
MIGLALKLLLAIPSKWKLALAAGIVVGGMALAITAYRAQAAHAKAETGRLSTELETARDAIAARDAALATLEEQRAKESAALAAQLKNDETRACRVQAIREETYHAKPDEDGPVASVLLRTLDGLRSPAGAGE